MEISGESRISQRRTNLLFGKLFADNCVKMKEMESCDFLFGVHTSLLWIRHCKLVDSNGHNKLKCQN